MFKFILVIGLGLVSSYSFAGSEKFICTANIINARTFEGAAQRLQNTPVTIEVDERGRGSAILVEDLGIKIELVTTKYYAPSQTFSLFVTDTASKQSVGHASSDNAASIEGFFSVQNADKESLSVNANCKHSL